MSATTTPTPPTPVPAERAALLLALRLGPMEWDGFDRAPLELNALAVGRLVEWSRWHSGGWDRYRLTPAGRALADALAAQAGPEGGAA